MGVGGRGAGRMEQPQQGSAGRTDNKKILEHFQERKVCIFGGGWGKKDTEEQKRPEGEYI